MRKVSLYLRDLGLIHTLKKKKKVFVAPQVSSIDHSGLELGLQPHGQEGAPRKQFPSRNGLIATLVPGPSWGLSITQKHLLPAGWGPWEADAEMQTSRPDVYDGMPLGSTSSVKRRGKRSGLGRRKSLVVTMSPANLTGALELEWPFRIFQN